MSLSLLLKLVEFILGFATGLVAIRGNTWRGVATTWYRHLTVSGWTAVGLLFLTFSVALGAVLVGEWEKEKIQHEAKASEDRWYRYSRENICWVVLGNSGARANYLDRRSRLGRSAYEAILEAQDHNPSTKETIRQYGLERTERFAAELERKIKSGEAVVGVEGACKPFVG